MDFDSGPAIAKRRTDHVLQTQASQSDEDHFADDAFWRHFIFEDAERGDVPLPGRFIEMHPAFPIALQGNAHAANPGRLYAVRPGVYNDVPRAVGDAHHLQ